MRFTGGGKMSSDLEQTLLLKQTVWHMTSCLCLGCLRDGRGIVVVPASGCLRHGVFLRYVRLGGIEGQVIVRPGGSQVEELGRL